MGAARVLLFWLVATVALILLVPDGRSRAGTFEAVVIIMLALPLLLAKGPESNILIRILGWTIFFTMHMIFPLANGGLRPFRLSPRPEGRRAKRWATALLLLPALAGGYALLALQQKHSFRLVFVSEAYEHADGYASGSLRRAYYDLMKEMASREDDIEYVDSHDLFRRRPLADLMVDRVHHTRFGNRLLAERLRERIVAMEARR